MNGPFLQESIALAIVLLAAAWLVRRWWRRRGQSSGCEHCPAAAVGHPPCQAPPRDMLITIGSGPSSSPEKPQPLIRR